MYTLERKLGMGTFMSSRTLVLLPPGARIRDRVGVGLVG